MCGIAGFHAIGIAAGTVTAHLARATRSLREHLEATSERETL